MSSRIHPDIVIGIHPHHIPWRLILLLFGVSLLLLTAFLGEEAMASDTEAKVRGLGWGLIGIAVFWMIARVVQAEREQSRRTSSLSHQAVRLADNERRPRV